VRINSRLFREYQFALPREGTREQKADLSRRFTIHVTEMYQVAAILAEHAAPDATSNNEHGHLLIATRKVVKDETGHHLGAKVRRLDDKGTLKSFSWTEKNCLLPF
jgi:hypothetical protein